MKCQSYFFCVIALLLGTQAAYAQDNAQGRLAYLDELVTAGHIPQYQFAFIDSQGSVTESKRHYVNGIVPVEAVSSDTLVALLSLSKPFTSLLALRLIDKGYLQLDSPISNYLPSFKKVSVQGEKGRVDAVRPILVSDLLLHTAGFAQNAELLGWGEIPNTYKNEGIFGLNCLAGEPKQTLGDVVENLSSLPLVNNPGEKFAYSVATDVLGRVLEVAAQSSFTDLIQEHVKEPLGLTSLTLEVSNDVPTKVAQLYGPLFKSYPVPGSYQRYEAFRQFDVDVVNVGIKPGCVSPGSGLLSNMKDLVHFAKFLLNDMKLKDGSSFLSEKSKRQFFSHQLGEELGKSPLRQSLAYANKDGLTLGSLAIRLKQGGSLQDPLTHDYYYWSGFSGSGFWLDKNNNSAGIFVTQLYPNDRFLIPKLVAQTRAKLAQ